MTSVSLVAGLLVIMGGLIYWVARLSRRNGERDAKERRLQDAVRRAALVHEVLAEPSESPGEWSNRMRDNGSAPAPRARVTVRR